METRVYAARTAPTLRTQIWEIEARFRVLRGEMLGAKPWARAFALEVLPTDTANFGPALEKLLFEVQNWAAKGDPGHATIKLEVIELALVQCRLASKEPISALEILSAMDVRVTERIAACRSNAGLLATEYSFLKARVAALVGDASRAIEEYRRAEAFSASLRTRSPQALRRHAAIAWFQAACLTHMEQIDDAYSVLQTGHAAATDFARLQIMDGPAILQAYESRGF